MPQGSQDFQSSQLSAHCVLIRQWDWPSPCSLHTWAYFPFLNHFLTLLLVLLFPLSSLSPWLIDYTCVADIPPLKPQTKRCDFCVCVCVYKLGVRVCGSFFMLFNILDSQFHTNSKPTAVFAYFFLETAPRLVFTSEKTRGAEEWEDKLVQLLILSLPVLS